MTPAASLAVAPEDAANQTLARAEIRRVPVDLSAVVGLWPELTVSREPLDGAGYLLDLRAAGGVIQVREQDPLARRRFTVAHEVAHWMLRREFGMPAAPPRDRRQHVAIERWCDQFAASLLMPRAWIRALSARLADTRDLDLFVASAGTARVSQTALRLRASEVCGMTLYEVIAHGGRLRQRHQYRWADSPNLTLDTALMAAVASGAVGQREQAWSDREHALLAKPIYSGHDEVRWLLARVPLGRATPPAPVQLTLAL